MSKRTADNMMDEMLVFERREALNVEQAAKDYYYTRQEFKEVMENYIETRKKMSQDYCLKAIDEGGKDCFIIYDKKDVHDNGKVAKNARPFASYSSKARAEFAIAINNSGVSEEPLYNGIEMPSDPVIIKSKLNNKIDIEYFNADFWYDEDKDLNMFSEWIVKQKKSAFTE